MTLHDTSRGVSLSGAAPPPVPAPFRPAAGLCGGAARGYGGGEDADKGIGDLKAAAANATGAEALEAA